MTHIALLRAINVGGRFAKMAVVKEIFESAGCKNIRIYLQSGNLVFQHSASAEILEKKLAAALEKKLKFDVDVIIRNIAQIKKIISKNPFIKEKGIDQERLYVTFLASKPSKEGVGALAAVKAGKDRHVVLGTEVYLYCPVSYGESKLSNSVVEKKLGLRGTTRNWNTVNALVDLAAQRVD